MATQHPAVTQLLRWFEYDHLPPHLQDVSRLFHFLAYELVEHQNLEGPELATALRKILEAKDCAVRAKLESAG